MPQLYSYTYLRISVSHNNIPHSHANTYDYTTISKYMPIIFYHSLLPSHFHIIILIYQFNQELMHHTISLTLSYSFTYTCLTNRSHILHMLCIYLHILYTYSITSYYIIKTCISSFHIHSHKYTIHNSYRHTYAHVASLYHIRSIYSYLSYTFYFIHTYINHMRKSSMYTSYTYSSHIALQAYKSIYASHSYVFQSYITDLCL